MKTFMPKFLIGAVATTAFVATPVLAEKAAQLVDINGMRGSSAESALQQRGFKHISTNKKSSGYVYSYWWNGSDDDCVQVEVYNGRVESITDATDQDCGHHKGSAGAAVGAVAGAALLGALLSHKSSHHDDNQHSADAKAEADYERGYTDGLHNAAYHNYDRSNSYSDGYQAGVDQREANLSHHQRRGGYAQVAQFKDLEGARAAGGMEELERRGFTQVDNFTSGNARYSIQWRPESRQCLQVIVADGRLEDLRDIGQHPKCRGTGGSGPAMGAAAPAQFNDVIGRTGERAREILNGRGFTRVARLGDDTTRYAIMWRAQSRQCLQLMIVNGRATDIRDIGQHPNCR